MKQKVFGFSFLLMGVFLSGCGQKISAPESDNLTKKEIPVTQQQEEEKTGVFSGTMEDLLSKKDNLVCTWSFNDQEKGTVSGKIYLSGEKFYQEFRTKGTEGEDLQSYLVSDGEWLYQWTNLSQTGTKVKVEETKKEASVSDKEGVNSSDIKNVTQLNAVDWNKQMNYDCQLWLVEENKLKAPENIQFIDLNQTFNSFQDSSSQILADTCKICENLPTEAKKECLKGCSQ